MKRLLLLVLMALPLTFLTAQDRLTQTWGGSNGEYGADVLLSGSNVVIAGSQKTSETIADDALLLSLTLQGSENWVRLTQVNQWDRANGIVPLSAGGFAYAGYCGAQSSTWDYILGKTDADGNTLWVHNYGVANKLERACGVVELPNGYFVLAGNNETDTQGWLVITDANGTQTGVQTLNYGYTSFANDIFLNPDGHALVVGSYKNTSSANSDILLVMLNATGTELWHQNIGGTPDHYGICGNNATDGFIIGGYVKASMFEQDLLLMKANTAGEMVWVQTYDADDYEQFNEVLQTSDGGFLAVGSTGNYSTKDWYILKTDAAGVEQWHQRIGGAANDECNAVTILPDGNYLAVGMNESYGAGQSDIWLVSLTPQGTVTDEQIIPVPSSTTLTCYPNPFRQDCHISAKGSNAATLTGAIYNLNPTLPYAISIYLCCSHIAIIAGTTFSLVIWVVLWGLSTG